MRALLRPLTRSFTLTLVLGAPATAQTIWYVDVNGTAPGTGTLADPYTSIQYALSQPATSNADTLLVLPGVYAERIDFLGKNVAVRSTSGAASTIIDANSTGSAVTFKTGEGPGAVLDGFLVRKGNGTADGGGMVDGGGIYVLNASPTLENLDVQFNIARRGSGIFLGNSNSLVTNCTVRLNNALCYVCYPTYGAGIWASGSPVFTNCTIVNNGVQLAGNEGGGTYGSGTFIGCTISANRAAWGAGARGIGASFFNCLITANQAVSVDGDPGFGGGVWGGTLDDCTLDGNYGGFQGGGAREATMTDCVLSNNRVSKPSSSYSGAIVSGGGASSCQLTNCDVFGNVAGATPSGSVRPGTGGGVFGGTAIGCRIHDNVSHAVGPIPGASIGDFGLGGGGAWSATLIECDIFSNRVTNDGLSSTTPGGGGLIGGSATRCRIWSNEAPYGAGAAGCSLTHCTLSANSASVAGGGVAALDSLNSATVTNCILWDNLGSETAVAGGTLTISYSDVEGGFAGAGNIDADPLFFGPLMHDYHLQSASPCIDAGDPASPSDPDASIADMGAYPFDANYCGTPSIYCVAKINSQGCLPTISFSGSNSFSGPDDFEVTASNVLSSNNGYLLWSSSAAQVPFAGGTLCLGPIIRTPVQNSGGTPPPADCTGMYAYQFSHAYLVSKGIGPGDTIYAQYLTRDPHHPDGTGKGLTDAVEVTFCP